MGKERDDVRETRVRRDDRAGRGKVLEVQRNNGEGGSVCRGEVR